MITLAVALCRNHIFEYLDITVGSNNEILDDGAMSIVKNRTLKTLNVSHSNISLKFVQLK